MALIGLHPKFSPGKIAQITLMAFLTFFTTGVITLVVQHGNLNHQKTLSIIITYLFMNTMFSLMILTGKIDRFRAIVFVAVALAFPVSFIPDLFELRGHFMTATYEDMIAGQVPFCHIVIPQTLIPLLTSGNIIFPGQLLSTAAFHHTAAAMIVIWASISLGIGRGFCSWVCFFGGWEDGCSRILKRHPVKRFHPALRYVPYALFTAIVLLSLVFVSPVYCMWLCPFKSVSEYIQVISPMNIVQTVIFIVLFLGLVIVLPILSGKRTQCSFLCPFGVMQGFVDKINAFTVRIKLDECVKCGKCKTVCPMMAIDDKSFTSGKPNNGCVKCGRCVDECPKKAVVFQIRGLPVGKLASFSRAAFMFTAFLIMASMGGSFIKDAMHRLFLLVSTGSILK